MASKRVRKKREKPSPLHCALCGRRLDPSQNTYIPGARGAAVCHKCIRIGNTMAMPKRSDLSKSGDLRIPTPRELQMELDKTIAGQTEAKRAASLALWKQRIRAQGDRDVPASHLLMYGPTGCGKTMLAKRAAELSGLPSCVFDSTTLTEAGYRGRDAADILKDYLEATKGHPYQKYGVVILDEIDKLAAEGSPDRQTYCRGTQRTLYKLLEGSMVPVGDTVVDTSKLLFVLCGVFSGLHREELGLKRSIGFLSEETEPMVQNICPEDFIACGMEPELMGRIADMAPIHQLTEADLLHILTKSEGSAFAQYKSFFASRGVELTLPLRTAEKIAKRTLDLGTGARGLKAELDKHMEPMVLALAEGELTGSVEVQDGFCSLQQEAR